MPGPLAIAAAPALIQAAGGIISGAANLSSADANRKFQRKMSNTAYRRTMRDMEKAGLNPILAGSVGGASTPSGAQANIQNPFKDVPNAVNSAIALKRSTSEIANIEQATKTGQASEAAQYSAAALSSANAQTANELRPESVRERSHQADIAMNNAKITMYNVTPAEAKHARAIIDLWITDMGLFKATELLRVIGQGGGNVAKAVIRKGRTPKK